jgi:hypothetical protein
MDLNDDGFLTEAELRGEQPAPSGCPLGKSAVGTGIRDFLGDIFLLGLALLSLTSWRILSQKSQE